MRTAGDTVRMGFRYAYNRDGSRRTFTTPNRTYTYAYGAGARLNGISFPTVTISGTVYPAGTVSFGWDALGRRGTVTLPASDSSALTTFGYDSAGNPVSVVASHSGQTQFSIVNLVFDTMDAAGRPRYVVDMSRRVGTPLYNAWGYDHRGELTSQVLESVPDTRSFAYDDDGNRIAEYVQSNDSTRYRLLANTDRIITRYHGYFGRADSVKYRHDGNGNIIWEKENLSGKFVPQTRYYDAAGQLVRARRTFTYVSGGVSRWDTVSVPYRYDGLGRRVSENALATIHDGSNAVNFNGAEFLHGPGLDDPLVEFAAPGRPLACAAITGPAAYAVTTGTGRLLDFHDAGGYDCTPYHPWTDYAQYAGAIRNSYGVGLSRAADTTTLSATATTTRGAAASHKRTRSVLRAASTSMRTLGITRPRIQILSVCARIQRIHCATLLKRRQHSSVLLSDSLSVAVVVRSLRWQLEVPLFPQFQLVHSQALQQVRASDSRSAMPLAELCSAKAAAVEASQMSPAFEGN